MSAPFSNIQEACDYAVKKIVDQGKQCKIGGDCEYFDPADESHCVAGHIFAAFLPNDHELFGGNGMGAAMVIETYRDEFPEWLVDESVAVDCLQNFHDSRRASTRKFDLVRLKAEGIDTSAPQWQQWVDMGAAD